MAQSLKVSVMGDSYSTYRGTMPKHFSTAAPTSAKVSLVPRFSGTMPSAA